MNRPRCHNRPKPRKPSAHGTCRSTQLQKLRPPIFQPRNQKPQPKQKKLHLLAAAIALPIVYSSASAQVCGNGVFLGQLSANPYSPTSINIPYSVYGSRFSPMSPNNLYATQAPVLCGDDD